MAYTPFGTAVAKYWQTRVFPIWSSIMPKSAKNDGKHSLSKVLRETIRNRGLTAYATAKQAGVSVDAVQRFMKDERGLTLQTVDKIADSLDLTLCPDKKSEETR
jgi:DNA-binding phage protein